MGRYLDMATSDKTNPKTGTVPNQNYAREALQLFSIGLVALNPDGTPQLDASGAPIPTYDAATIEGFSAAFTGWGLSAATWHARALERPDQLPRHDGGVPRSPRRGHAKTLLNGYTIPANQTPAQDLADALDNIFNHPNVGPFISQQLIQHLVTSNPTPAYVGRVAAVFANNGQGVRGDLSAVVRAILTDTEARGPAPPTNVFGHLREPALFITSALRSLGLANPMAFSCSMRVWRWESPYSPRTPYLVTTRHLIRFRVPRRWRQNSASTMPQPHSRGPILSIPSSWRAAPRRMRPLPIAPERASIWKGSLLGARNNTTLIAQLNQTLMHGSLSSDASNIILTTADAVAASSKDPLAPARVAAYLILTSAQYQVER